MKFSIIILLLLYIDSLVAFHPPNVRESCTHTNNIFRCVKYLKNYDGDTITFYIKDIHPLLGQNIPVRVRGVDTAELSANTSCEIKKARAAKTFVFSVLSKARRIDLENVKRGKYFRILADVKVDGVSLSNMLLSRRLAVSYGGKKKKANWCKDQKNAEQPN